TEARVAITPMGDTIRYAGTLELSGNDLTINPRRVKAILRAADRYLENFDAQSSDIQTAWAGLRPCSPDGLPFIGRFKRAPNVIAATGHAMLGITLGPITGKLVSEIVTNTPQTITSPLLDADRYA
ncbi:MAG TPA: FAD-dependent oxidoreductase, partial [bacterium]|nr:FAD-dependent oxidoreductase [bacterium]